MRTAGLKNIVDPSLATPSSSTEAQSLGNHESKSLSPCPLTKQKCNIWVGRPGRLIVYIGDLLEIWQEGLLFYTTPRVNLARSKTRFSNPNRGMVPRLELSCPSCSALHIADGLGITSTWAPKVVMELPGPPSRSRSRAPPNQRRRQQWCTREERVPSPSVPNQRGSP